MRDSRPLLAALILALAAAAPAAAAQAEREILRLRIVNDADGPIAASRDAGLSWQRLGRVLRYTAKVNPQGYTASKWVPAGEVAATAVNAIHISVGYNADRDRGIVFSILPREMLAVGRGYASFLSPDSSIYTDIPAGRAIFGGGAAPLVGSCVRRESPVGELCPIAPGYVPARGDVLVIIVSRPSRYPTAVLFCNQEGGAVCLSYADGSRELLGWVVKPVRGVGRFLGSLHAGVGRIRANHAGVLDISTSPLGSLGAFQIIPFGHALSPEMATAWRLTQWMVVGPLREDSSLWDGLGPLFRRRLRPDYLAEDLYAPDWRNRLLSRFLVEVDLGDGWRPMPALRLSPDPAVALPPWAHGALGGIRRIRVLFPLEERAALGP